MAAFETTLSEPANEIFLQSDYEEFLTALSQLIENLEKGEGDISLFKESLNRAIEFLQYLVVQEKLETGKELVRNLVTQLRIILQDVRSKEVNLSCCFMLNHTPCFEKKKGPGRPSHKIRESTILELKELGFSWKEISHILIVSRWTLWRRVKELGLQEVVGYSNLSNDELDEIIKDFKKIHGIVVGRSLAIGHLKSLGLNIQKRRVTESLARVDPVNSKIRWAALVHRRKYSVPGPNSLWHIDGHHSLVRWGFVVHGCIDGFSRYITFLKCSTNNRKETVLSLFEEAISVAGVPSRIRTDKGGENVLIWDKMIELRGENRGSYLASSSVHNQRIERLWRDVWNSVACEFYYTFQALESQGILFCDNQIHLWILHHVYLPRIQHAILSFIQSWNNHPLRTMKNWSPRKLWMNGMIDLRNRSMQGDQDTVDEWFGMDWSAPAPTDDGLSSVEVEDIDVNFDDQTLARLNAIDPLTESNTFGIDIYTQALEIFTDLEI